MIDRHVVVTLAHGVVAVPDVAYRILDTMLSAAERAETPLDFVTADVQFHQALLDALKSPRMDRMYSQLIGETQLCMAQVQFRHLLDPAVIVTEHREIIEAIETHDPEAAGAYVERHLMNACERLTERL